MRISEEINKVLDKLYGVSDNAKRIGIRDIMDDVEDAISLLTYIRHACDCLEYYGAIPLDV